MEWYNCVINTSVDTQDRLYLIHAIELFSMQASVPTRHRNPRAVNCLLVNFNKYQYPWRSYFLGPVLRTYKFVWIMFSSTQISLFVAIKEKLGREVFLIADLAQDVNQHCFNGRQTITARIEMKYMKRFNKKIHFISAVNLAGNIVNMPAVPSQ